MVSAGIVVALWLASAPMSSASVRKDNLHLDNRSQ